MKFGRILRDSPAGQIARIVVVQPEKNRVIDLARATALHYIDKYGATDEAARRVAETIVPGSMAQALSMGSFMTDHAGDVVAARGDDASLPIDEVTWLPASDPPVLRDSLNFKIHMQHTLEGLGRECPDTWLTYPIYCQNNNAMVLGNEAGVEWPGYTDYMDYELELGWVVGRKCRDLRPENVRDCLFGVTLYNDFSARDIQRAEHDLGGGHTKSKNFGHAIGPWITTLDEFDDIYDIRLEARVNGVTKCKTTSGNTLWQIEEHIAYLSLAEYLQPGDVIGSGTVGGGSLRELGERLSPGDVVELEGAELGILRNTIGEKQELPYWPVKREPFM